jgi:hypothetical protein
LKNRNGSSRGLILPTFTGYTIPYEELTFDKEIGRGAYGLVWKGTWRGATVAIKQVIELTTIFEVEFSS